MVRLRLPDSDGLARGAPQHTAAGHQRRADTGGPHVHTHVVNFRHEQVKWVPTVRAKGPGAVGESDSADTEPSGKLVS